MDKSRIRSILEEVSYRLVGMLITTLFVYHATGNWHKSIVIGIMDTIVRIIVTYIHQRIWAEIPMGPSKHPAAKLQIKKNLNENEKSEIQKQLMDLGLCP
jgi:uncharacterized membrane protein